MQMQNERLFTELIIYNNKKVVANILKCKTVLKIAQTDIHFGSLIRNVFF